MKQSKIIDTLETYHGALEPIYRVERDGALGPSERAHGLELGENCIHFASKLFEDTL